MIPAGGSGKLTAKITAKAGGRSGRHGKSISVETDAPDAQLMRLSLSYTVVTPIVATPSFRINLTGIEGTPTSQRVLLHRADGKPLEVEMVRSSVPDGLELSFEPVSSDSESTHGEGPKPGDIWMVAKFDGTTGGILHNGVVILATNQPEVPEIEMPVFVRVRSMIDVRPARVKLWPPVGGPHGTTALVRLTQSERRPFEITGVAVSDPKLINARVESEGAQKVHSLRINLVDGVELDGSSVTATVRLNTSDATRPTVEVPVLIVADNRAAQRSRTYPTPKETAAGSS